MEKTSLVKSYELCFGKRQEAELWLLLSFTKHKAWAEGLSSTLFKSRGLCT